MIGIGETVDYLKELHDPEDKRHHRRLFVRIPVLYAVKSMVPTEFRQAMGLDISSGGIRIELLDPPEEVEERLKRQGTEVLLRFDVPGHGHLLNAEAETRWHHLRIATDHRRLFVGLSFHPLSLDSQIELMSYAVRTARRHLRRRVALAVAGILAAVSLGVGAGALISRNLVARDQRASQRILQKMEQRLQELALEKMELERRIEQLRQAQGR